MMRLTKRQQADIDFYLQFCPKKMLHSLSNEEVKEFLDFSERGIKPIGKVGGASEKSLNPAIVGKNSLGLNIKLWQEGVLEGSVPYFVLLGGFCGDKRKWWQFWKPKFSHQSISRRLVDYMKTQMFKGIDAEIIEKCYQSLIEEGGNSTFLAYLQKTIIRNNIK